MIAIAWLALCSWPIVSYVLYRKYSLPVALCAIMIGGYLLLPAGVGLDLPILPELNKISIPTLCALVLTALHPGHGGAAAQALPGWRPRDLVTLGLLAMLLVGTFGTTFTNGDTLIYGPRIIQGLALYDTFSMLLQLAVMLTPFFLARRFLATPQGQRILLSAIAISALCYTLPALWEVRMSPQLHVKLYGFFQHSFAQHVRNDGFRPIVFLEHGLSLGIFLTYAVISVVVMFRISEPSRKLFWLAAGAWLFVVLVLAKALGALMIAVLLVPVAAVLKPRMQLLLAACIAAVVMTYPMLRAAQLVPVNEVMSLVSDISEERAKSFNTRIESEELLLAKARERPLFGWGDWGRNRVFDDKGRDLALTDGSWAIEMGTGGWVRYIAIFGLLCWPIVGLFFRKADRIDRVSAALALVLCAKLIDLIPNSGMQPLIWMLSGALVGRMERKPAPQDDPAVQVAQSAGRQTQVYARSHAKPVAKTAGHTPRYTRDSVALKPAAPAAKLTPSCNTLSRYRRET